MDEGSGTDEAVVTGGGFSRRTLLKGSAFVGAALMAAPVVESFVGGNPAAGASPLTGASEVSAGSLAPGTLAEMALAAAMSLGSENCTPIWSGYTMPITADCIDPRYNQPYIDINEPGETPVNHVQYQYVHGGFTGTDAKFAFYFPAASQYQGRFFQSTYPLVSPPFGSGGEAESPANIEFSIASGGYAVHTNMGGTEGIMSTADDLVRHLDPSQGAYRVNAAAAKFSRLVAQQFYGHSHRPFGYIYGASGGAFQTVAAAENTMGVWDGAVPEVMGTPNSIPSNFTIEIYALRVISQASFAKIVDALAPGGSGDPYAGLSPDEQAALLEATRLGFPQRGWWDYATLTGGTALLDLTGAYVPTLDPSYVVDFWSEPGYEGHDNPALKSLRIQFPTTVVSVVGSPPTGLVLNGPLPTGDLIGAYLVFTSGAAAGQLVPVGAVTGNTVTFGFGADATVVSQIQPGDHLTIDNSWFLALQTYHRHQMPPPDANLYAWDQYRNPDGTPKYPRARDPDRAGRQRGPDRRQQRRVVRAGCGSKRAVPRQNDRAGVDNGRLGLPVVDGLVPHTGASRPAWRPRSEFPGVVYRQCRSRRPSRYSRSGHHRRLHRSHTAGPARRQRLGRKRNTAARQHQLPGGRHPGPGAGQRQAA